MWHLFLHRGLSPDWRGLRRLAWRGFGFSGGCFRTFVEERFEFDPNEFRVHALHHGADAFEHELLHLDGMVESRFDLVRYGKKEDVGGRDAVYRRDERYSNAAADFFNVLEMIHHLDQA